MRKIQAFFSALFVAFSPVFAFAHAGHGTLQGHELAHYLTSPAHVLPTLAILAICAYFIYQRFAKKTSKQ